jgi:hypothetical protein
MSELVLLTQLDYRETQVLGHAAVAVLLGLIDALLVGGPHLFLAPEARALR